eukprot:UN31944
MKSLLRNDDSLISVTLSTSPIFLNWDTDGVAKKCGLYPHSKEIFNEPLWSKFGYKHVTNIGPETNKNNSVKIVHNYSTNKQTTNEDFM